MLLFMFSLITGTHIKPQSHTQAISYRSAAKVRCHTIEKSRALCLHTHLYVSRHPLNSSSPSSIQLERKPQKIAPLCLS